MIYDCDHPHIKKVSGCAGTDLDSGLPLWRCLICGRTAPVVTTQQLVGERVRLMTEEEERKTHEEKR